MKRTAVKLLAVVTLLAGSDCAARPEQRDLSDLEQLDGFQKLLKRGEIPAVDEPVFVPAAEAGIADDAWVIGVYAGNSAKAYSISLLNEHEVVNDRLDGAPIATTW